MKILLNEVKPDPNQPRKIINEKSVENLAKSMKVEGLIHPIEVDKNYIIIVGEMRYRAAKLLGWDKIEANIYKGELHPYERLRRQMAENLQQSGAKGGGESMNALDTAKAWAKLYELKTGKPYSPGENGQPRTSGGKFADKDVDLKNISEEVGVSLTNVWEYLQLLEEPSYVLESLVKPILKGKPIPRTFYREAERLPESVKGIEVREPIKRAISEGKIERRDDIVRLANTLASKPEKAEIEMARIFKKQSTDANRILDRALELQIALKNATPENWSDVDKSVVRGQLGSTTGAIRSFVGKINDNS